MLVASSPCGTGQVDPTSWSQRGIWARCTGLCYAKGQIRLSNGPVGHWTLSETQETQLGLYPWGIRLLTLPLLVLAGLAKGHGSPWTWDSPTCMCVVAWGCLWVPHGHGVPGPDSDPLLQGHWLTRGPGSAPRSHQGRGSPTTSTGLPPARAHPAFPAIMSYKQFITPH